MKNLMIVLALVLLLGNSLWAQYSAGSSSVILPPANGQGWEKGDQDGDGVSNAQDPDYVRGKNSQNIQKSACPPDQRPGRGLGDGTKPRPQNGTGFGSQQKSSGTQTGVTQGQGKKMRLRDGSCITASTTQNSTQGSGRGFCRGRNRN